MENDTIRQLRLGIFVVSGTVLLLAAMYLIGRNQNLFGRTIRVNAYFNNVNGLQPGNNVRFAGSDAGTVESVEVINDTAVQVTIVLREEYASFIRQDAIAGIGTDGLMGNKLINIINAPGSQAASVHEGSIISTSRPVETEEMLRTLNRTNRYVEGIAHNLMNVTDQIGTSRGVLWKLMTDTSLAADADAIFNNVSTGSRHIAGLSKQLELAAANMNKGNGLLGILLTDTMLPRQLQRTAAQLKTAGEQSAGITANLLRFTNDIDSGKGTLGLLLRDSSASGDLRAGISSIRQSAESLRQTLDAVQKIPLLKKYIDQENKRTGRKSDH